MTGIRSATAFVIISVIASACTATTSIGPPTTTLTEPDPPLLVIGNTSGGVTVINADGSTVGQYDPPEGAGYTQPVWASPDTIVYAQAGEDDSRLEAARISGELVWSIDLSTPPFYYLPAPDSDSATVLSLRNNTGAPGLISERISGPDSVEPIGTESPFYASWNPVDGTFASHVGDSRLDITGTSTETISTTADGFQAPVWLRDGLITLRTRSDDMFLSMWVDRSFTDIARVRGAARFVASGDRIAITTGGFTDTNGIQTFAQSLPTIPAGVLTVIDLGSRSFTSVTSEPSPLFQWDPHGERLLYATFVDDPAPALVWHVWEDGAIVDFEPFVPEASWFGTVAPFFDQYAQSVSLWSPDGSAFAYPALVEGGGRILVQHVDEPSPRDIAAGNWVAWSPGR